MDKPNFPIIIESETSNLDSGTKTQAKGIFDQAPFKGDFGGKFSNAFSRFGGPKIVFFVLGVVILAELVVGIRTLLLPVPTVGKVKPLTGGKFVLTSARATYGVGEPVKVRVRLVTGGHNVNGADLVLKYDPAILDINNQSALQPGTIYKDYPLKTADQKSGIVRISGISDLSDKPFNGIGEFAEVNFRAKAEGKTTVSVDFKPGATTDSNITEEDTSQDILDKVYNLDLTVSK